jgi:DNA-binding protein H-NS
MSKPNFENMPLEELWKFYEQVWTALDAKVQQEKYDLERRIELLAQRMGRDPREPRLRIRRPYPKVQPKFRNPHAPSITWSGRGKQPRWVTELLAKGENLEKLRV